MTDAEIRAEFKSLTNGCMNDNCIGAWAYNFAEPLMDRAFWKESTEKPKDSKPKVIIAMRHNSGPNVYIGRFNRGLWVIDDSDWGVTVLRWLDIVFPEDYPME